MRFSNILESKETVTLVDLPYGYSDLAPCISEANVKLHYDVLSRGYVDRFNAGEGDLVFNKAGVALHNLWWVQLMKPKTNNQPKGAVLQLLEEKYGDWVDFRDQLIDEAVKFQGSGWVYMAKDGSIKTLKNQTWKSDVILPIDIWEHSYLSDYGADRKKYIRNLFRIINWNVINDRLNISL